MPEVFIPLADLPKEQVPKISQMLPSDQAFRIKSLLFRVQSINDKKGTATVTVEGVFLPSEEQQEEPKQPSRIIIP